MRSIRGAENVSSAPCSPSGSTIGAASRPHVRLLVLGRPAVGRYHGSRWRSTALADRFGHFDAGSRCSRSPPGGLPGRRRRAFVERAHRMAEASRSALAGHHDVLLMEGQRRVRPDRTGDGGRGTDETARASHEPPLTTVGRPASLRRPASCTKIGAVHSGSGPARWTRDSRPTALRWRKAGR